MTKTISSSQLRSDIKRILNEVQYGGAHYVVEKFGQPAAAIVSVEDLEFIQERKQKEAISTLRETIAQIRANSRGMKPAELDKLIEEALAAFHQSQRGRAEG
jgi:prevent-host-death family protein